MNTLTSKDENFMESALQASVHSNDPETQVGACIVNEENQIVATGYNDFPRGCENYSWSKDKTDIFKHKRWYVVHAEANAILNKNAADIRGSRIYVTLFPCNECAKLIIQSGISEVIYKSDERAHKKYTMAAKRMLHSSWVKCRQI